MTGLVFAAIVLLFSVIGAVSYWAAVREGDEDGEYRRQLQARIDTIPVADTERMLRDER